MQAPLQASS
jgi:hypothetical protein